MGVEPLSPEDMKRIKDCDNYGLIKRTIKSCEEYKDHEVGTAVFINEKLKDGTTKFVGTGYQGKQPPDKYIIVYKDEGFVFAKRIITTGKPGVQITCLTIDYPSSRYELIVDNDYLDAMLLDTLDTYDPAAAAKDTLKKKGKATRINAKSRILFDDKVDAYNYLKNMKVGDIIWSAQNMTGDNIVKHEIIKVEEYTLDPKLGHNYGGYYGREFTHIHATHIKESFLKGIKVSTKVLESARYGNALELCFYHITNIDKYKYDKKILFTSKPVKHEDIV